MDRYGRWKTPFWFFDSRGGVVRGADHSAPSLLTLLSSLRSYSFGMVPLPGGPGRSFLFLQTILGQSLVSWGRRLNKNRRRDVS